MSHARLTTPRRESSQAFRSTPAAAAPARGTRAPRPEIDQRPRQRFDETAAAAPPSRPASSPRVKTAPRVASVAPAVAVAPAVELAPLPLPSAELLEDLRAHAGDLGDPDLALAALYLAEDDGAHLEATVDNLADATAVLLQAVMKGLDLVQEREVATSGHGVAFLASEMARKVALAGRVLAVLLEVGEATVKQRRAT